MDIHDEPPKNGALREAGYRQSGPGAGSEQKDAAGRRALENVSELRGCML
jgi:hypothetical protein